MTQNEKKEDAKQSLPIKISDFSTNIPFSVLPAALAIVVFLLSFYVIIFTGKISHNSPLYFIIISLGIISLLGAFFLLLLNQKNATHRIGKNIAESIINQDGLKHLTDEIFVTTNQELLHNYIKKSFSLINNGGEAVQTYIGAFPISGARDLIEGTPHDNNISVERIFGITSPYEVNFLCASEDKKKSLIVDTNGKHKINNRIFQINLSEIGFKHVSNLTLFNNFVLVTFKTKRPSLFPDSSFSLKRRFPPLFADDETTICIGIVGGEASKLIKSDYLNRISSQKSCSLVDIKKNLYYANPVEYLAAIGYSVAKEIAFLKEFNPYNTENKGSDRLGFIGIVGSLAEILKDKNDDVKDIPNDIDLLFFISNESLKALPKMYKAAIEVAKRYSIEGLLHVEVDNEMRPRFDKADGKVSIQIIINDYSSVNKKSFVSAMKSSNFTMATRLHCNIPLYGSLSEFYSPQKVEYKDVLNEKDCFSVTRLIKMVEEMKVCTRFWDSNLLEMREEQRNIETKELPNLYKYCVKWGLTNLYFASTSSPKIHGVSFKEMISNMNAFFDPPELTANGQILTKEECLNILKKIHEYAINKMAI